MTAAPNPDLVFCCSRGPDNATDPCLYAPCVTRQILLVMHDMHVAIPVFGPTSLYSPYRLIMQVQVVDFKERPGAKDYIQIVISVENESQRPILLGKKGSALKQLATSARIDIEDFLGARVTAV